jgi:hypothetical protein
MHFRKNGQYDRSRESCQDGLPKHGFNHVRHREGIRTGTKGKHGKNKILKEDTNNKENGQGEVFL